MNLNHLNNLEGIHHLHKQLEILGNLKRKNMDIKQYLHYYLNCKCLVDFSQFIPTKAFGAKYDKTKVPCVFDSINKNVDIDQCWGVTVQDEDGFRYLDATFDTKPRFYQHFVKSTNIKPILRRLADIELQHAMFIVKSIVHDNVNYPESDYRMSVNEYGNVEIKIDNDWHVQALVIGKNGAIWLQNQRSYNQKISPVVYHQLMQWGYWIFGDEAFEQNLIIDAKTV